MAYRVGELLKIEDEQYEIVGYINFQSTNENSYWTEYRMLNTAKGQEWWLSADDYNNEYSLSRIADRGRGLIAPDTTGYHMVDMGTAVVMGFGGNVDVDRGETVNYTEFEDLSEDNIISVEEWSDETEHSKGFYVDTHDIEVVGMSRRPARSNGNNKLFALVVIMLIWVCFAFASFVPTITAGMTKSIDKHLKDSGLYTYSTSVTSNIDAKQKANVYTTVLDIDAAAKDIIDAVEGKTEDVQQNNEDADDNSIAILTKKEYCLIYTDSETGGTLVQVSSRLYTYTSDSQVYHSRASTHRYYRRYYYSRAYDTDKGSYGKKYTGSYDSYDGGTVVSNSSDTYKTYSNSVRQASVAARSSSGGGTSSGK